MQSKTMKAKAQSLSLNQCNSAERKELRCNERLKKKKKKELTEFGEDEEEHDDGGDEGD